jgi:hypothetical protein
MILLEPILVATDFSDTTGFTGADGRPEEPALRSIRKRSRCGVIAVRHPEHECIVPDATEITANQKAGGLS